MTLLDLRKSKDERTSQERGAMEVYAPKSDKPILVRKGQHLDVDGILARSLPNPGAFSAPDVKTIVSR